LPVHVRRRWPRLVSAAVTIPLADGLRDSACSLLRRRSPIFWLAGACHRLGGGAGLSCPWMRSSRHSPFPGTVGGTFCLSASMCVFHCHAKRQKVLGSRAYAPRSAECSAQVADAEFGDETARLPGTETGLTIVQRFAGGRRRGQPPPTCCAARRSRARRDRLDVAGRARALRLTWPVEVHFSTAALMATNARCARAPPLPCVSSDDPSRIPRIFSSASRKAPAFPSARRRKQRSAAGRARHRRFHAE